MLVGFVYGYVVLLFLGFEVFLIVCLSCLLHSLGVIYVFSFFVLVGRILISLLFLFLSVFRSIVL